MKGLAAALLIVASTGLTALANDAVPYLTLPKEIQFYWPGGDHAITQVQVSSDGEFPMVEIGSAQGIVFRNQGKPDYAAAWEFLGLLNRGEIESLRSPANESFVEYATLCVKIKRHDPAGDVDVVHSVLGPSLGKPRNSSSGNECQSFE